MQHKKSKLRLATLSIVGSLVVFGIKTYAFWLTGSVALRSDAIESIVNIIAAIFAFGSLRFALRPADENHPYGHGKMEFISAFLEGGLVCFASLFIFFEAASALFEGSQLRNLSAGIWWGALGGLLNGALGWYLIKRGRALGSKALEADGHHVLTDFGTSVGIVAGMLLVQWTGLSILDPIMAIVVSVVLGRVGFKIIKSSFGALLDEEDPEILHLILDKVNTWPVDEVITIHKLRAMRSGNFVHIDVHILFPEFMDVLEAHRLSHEFAEALLTSTGMKGEWHTHMEPCRKNYCEVCPVKDCPIRLKPYKARFHLTREQAISPVEVLP